MRWGQNQSFLYSLMLHIVVVVLLIGLPFFGNTHTDPQPAITVEVVKVGPKTQGPTKKAQKKQADAKPPQKEKPKKSVPKPKPKPVKPKPVEKPAELLKKPAPKPEKKELPKKESVPKLVEEKEPDAKPDPKKAEQDDAAFNSVLKNLVEEKPEEESDKEDDPKTDNTSLIEPAEELTISEKDAVSRQFMPCWNLLAGAKEAADMVVDIKIAANPDGTVREAHIVNTARMAYDKTFEAAALSARRAVLNPKCSPLKLPAEKYTQWKNITLRFNPKHMF